MNAPCTAGTLPGSLHRLSHFILTATLGKAGAIHIILTFTDKETDKIQILLIYLDRLLGTRPYAFALMTLFFFLLKNHLLSAHSVCQYGKYCYSYNKTQLEVVD